LLDELAGLEQEVLDERLMNAEHVPIHHPGPSRIEECRQPFRLTRQQHLKKLSIIAHRTEEDEEEAQLKELQAELAM